MAARAAGRGVKELSSVASVPKVTSDMQVLIPALRCARTAHSIAASSVCCVRPAAYDCVHIKGCIHHGSQWNRKHNLWGSSTWSNTHPAARMPNSLVTSSPACRLKFSSAWQK